MIRQTEDEPAASGHICMCEPGVGMGLAIELHSFDVHAPRRLPFGLEDQLAAIGEGKRRAIEERRAEDIVRAYGIDGIEADRAEHVPSRHLAAVLVASHAVRI